MFNYDMHTGIPSTACNRRYLAEFYLDGAERLVVENLHIALCEKNGSPLNETTLDKAPTLN